MQIIALIAAVVGLLSGLATWWFGAARRRKSHLKQVLNIQKAVAEDIQKTKERKLAAEKARQRLLGRIRKS